MFVLCNSLLGTLFIRVAVKFAQAQKIALRHFCTKTFLHRYFFSFFDYFFLFIFLFFFIIIFISNFFSTNPYPWSVTFFFFLFFISLSFIILFIIYLFFCFFLLTYKILSRGKLTLGAKLSSCNFVFSCKFVLV